VSGDALGLSVLLSYRGTPHIPDDEGAPLMSKLDAL
jgi:hypothetical protein